MRDSMPTVVLAMILARGFRPNFATALSEAISMALAPSLMPDALPAVIVPSALTMGLSFARPSRVVSARGCSSFLQSQALPCVGVC